MLAEDALMKAIQHFGGSQTKLAQAIGERPKKVMYWLNHAKRIPFDAAIAIEKATQGLVSCYDLAPHARKNYQPSGNQENTYGLSQSSQMTISERVQVGLHFEKQLGYRQGKGSDLPSVQELYKNQQLLEVPKTELRRKCAQVKGKTSALAAQEAGFSSRDSYLRAKKVAQYGLFQLVALMDTKQISIAAAARIAGLPPKEQENALKQEKNKRSQLIISSKNNKPVSTKNNSPDNEISLAALESTYQCSMQLILLVLTHESNTNGLFCWDITWVKEKFFKFLDVDIQSIFEILIQNKLLEKIMVGEKMYGKLSPIIINHFKK